MRWGGRRERDGWLRNFYTEPSPHLPLAGWSLEANWEEARGRGKGAGWFVPGRVGGADRVDPIDLIDRIDSFDQAAAAGW